MTWNSGMRQFHRWMSVLFTVTVVANFVAMAMNGGVAPMWVTYSPLFPLFLLFITGAYMFVLPYLTRRRSGGQS